MFKLLFSVFFAATVAAHGIDSYDEVNAEVDTTIKSRDLANGPTIMSLVKSDKSFDTLQAVLEVTGLDEILGSDGPFTVFAPTDKAFEKLGEDTIQALLDDPDTLTDILLYHVVDGKVLRKNLKNDIIKAVNGDNLRIGVDKDDVDINVKSDITKFNIMASNGVVHVIDEVLIPPNNLWEIIESDERFTTLATAIKAAGLVSTLEDMKGEYTIFAPTNKAFDLLGDDTIEALLDDPDTLKSILLYHTLTGSLLKIDFRNSGRMKTVEGSRIRFKNEHNRLFINNIKVTQTNILAANGMIHVIEKVLTIPE